MSVRYTAHHHLNSCIEVDGQIVHLAPMENNILFLLYINAGREVTVDEMFEFLWGADEDGGPMYVEGSMSCHLTKIRRKTGLVIRGTWRRSMVLEPHDGMRQAA